MTGSAGAVAPSGRGFGAASGALCRGLGTGAVMALTCGATSRSGGASLRSEIASGGVMGVAGGAGGGWMLGLSVSVVQGRGVVPGVRGSATGPKEAAIWAVCCAGASAVCGKGRRGVNSCAAGWAGGPGLVRMGSWGIGAAASGTAGTAAGAAGLFGGRGLARLAQSPYHKGRSKAAGGKVGLVGRAATWVGRGCATVARRAGSGHSTARRAGCGLANTETRGGVGMVWVKVGGNVCGLAAAAGGGATNCRGCVGPVWVTGGWAGCGRGHSAVACRAGVWPAAVCEFGVCEVGVWAATEGVAGFAGLRFDNGVLAGIAVRSAGVRSGASRSGASRSGASRSGTGRSGTGRAIGLGVEL